MAPLSEGLTFQDIQAQALTSVRGKAGTEIADIGEATSADTLKACEKVLGQSIPPELGESVTQVLAGPLESAVLQFRLQKEIYFASLNRQIEEAQQSKNYIRANQLTSLRNYLEGTLAGREAADYKDRFIEQEAINETLLDEGEVYSLVSSLLPITSFSVAQAIRSGLADTAYGRRVDVDALVRTQIENLIFSSLRGVELTNEIRTSLLASIDRLAPKFMGDIVGSVLNLAHNQKVGIKFTGLSELAFFSLGDKVAPEVSPLALQLARALNYSFSVQNDSLNYQLGVFYSGLDIANKNPGSQGEIVELLQNQGENNSRRFLKILGDPDISDKLYVSYLAQRISTFEQGDSFVGLRFAYNNLSEQAQQHVKNLLGQSDLSPEILLNLCRVTGTIKEGILSESELKNFNAQLEEEKITAQTERVEDLFVKLERLNLISGAEKLNFAGAFTLEKHLSGLKIEDYYQATLVFEQNLLARAASHEVFTNIAKSLGLTAEQILQLTEHLALGQSSVDLSNPESWNKDLSPEFKKALALAGFSKLVSNPGPDSVINFIKTCEHAGIELSIAQIVQTYNLTLTTVHEANVAFNNMHPSENPPFKLSDTLGKLLSDDYFKFKYPSGKNLFQSASLSLNSTNRVLYHSATGELVSTLPLYELPDGLEVLPTEFVNSLKTKFSNALKHSQYRALELLKTADPSFEKTKALLNRGALLGLGPFLTKESSQFDQSSEAKAIKEAQTAVSTINILVQRLIAITPERVASVIPVKRLRGILTQAGNKEGYDLGLSVMFPDLANHPELGSDYKKLVAGNLDFEGIKNLVNAVIANVINSRRLGIGSAFTAVDNLRTLQNASLSTSLTSSRQLLTSRGSPFRFLGHQKHMAGLVKDRGFSEAGFQFPISPELTLASITQLEKLPEFISGQNRKSLEELAAQVKALQVSINSNPGAPDAENSVRRAAVLGRLATGLSEAIVDDLRQESDSNPTQPTSKAVRSALGISI